MNDEKKEMKIQIQLDEHLAQGTYINMAAVNHTQTEFIMDFIFLQPQAPRGRVQARIISSPIHTKRLLQALEENIRKYEDRFGEIKLPPPSAAKTEFFH
ncbi:MAG: DUF3467 domain-containing protein [bacterium]|nr:DUF3467 domain-containing protein [bacterium]